MTEKRSCTWCQETGITEKGFCHMCSGKGHQEVLKKADTIKELTNVNIKEFIMSISKFTTAEQLSSIMSDYMNNTQLDS